jgi:isocitrate lyase
VACRRGCGRAVSEAFVGAASRCFSLPASPPSSSATFSQPSHAAARGCPLPIPPSPLALTPANKNTTTNKQEDVDKLRGSVLIKHTLAERGAEKLWELCTEEPFVPALGALTGGQAVQSVRAGLKAIYCSGWQVAADANSTGQVYPDQSLYPADSVPKLVARINRALARADQVEHAEGGATRDWYAPIVADAEAGFGGPLNCFELMKAMIEAGAAGVHFEDQLSSEKKCG